MLPPRGLGSRPRHGVRDGGQKASKLGGQSGSSGIQGSPARYFWRIAVLPQPRDLGTIHCRHHFSDIIGWLVTIHVHSSLESGRACTYDNYAIWSTEYGIWIMEFGIQYGKWDLYSVAILAQVFKSVQEPSCHRQSNGSHLCRRAGSCKKAEGDITGQ